MTIRPLRSRTACAGCGVDHVDLYLIHWPQGGPTWAWGGMQKALERGHARAIGVSNFSIAEIDELLGVADVRPVMNQVQFSAFEYRRELLAGCRERGLEVTAYSSLGTGRHLDDPDVTVDRASAWGALRRRSFCAGASRRGPSSSRRAPTASASRRTPDSSTSSSTTPTSRRSTPWTPRAAPSRLAKASGGTDR